MYSTTDKRQDDCMITHSHKQTSTDARGGAIYDYCPITSRHTSPVVKREIVSLKLLSACT